MTQEPDMPQNITVVEFRATPASPATFGGPDGSASLTLGDAMACYAR